MINLDAMLSELASADPIFSPSTFWDDINVKNLRMLEAEGLANFKRTVSQNYFNWLIADHTHPYFKHVFHQWRANPNFLPLLTWLGETSRLRLTTANERRNLSLYERQMYRLYVCFVWTIMMQNDRRGLRHRIQEPKIGNPFPIRYGTQILSQDLASSIMECNIIADLTKTKSLPKIAEVGAGYGRVAQAYVSALSGKYFIFDIPPALGVAEWYLEQTVGSNRVFKFRRFDKMADIQGELDDCSVALFTPNQIEKFPDQYFDVSLSISTLPEMRPEQVKMYLKELQRITAGHIFLKQWRSWKNPLDGTDLSASDYEFSDRWKLTLDRTDPVIPDFFNRVWSTRSEATNEIT
jgi:putative sugar O-methyltransferase